MAEIEDFVVEAVMNDMQQQMVQPNAMSGQPIMASQPQPEMGAGNLQSSIPGGGSNADYANRMAQNRFMDVNPETGQRWGAYADQYEQQRVAALQRRDQARTTIMQAIKGMDPQVQATVLRRLGIDPGVVKSELEQQKEMLQFKQQLQAPQQETENAIKMMGQQRQLAQGAQELNFKERELAAKNQGQGESRNLNVIKVLAMMAQNNPQLQATIGPLLMQMLQGMGINLAAPGQAPARSSGGRGAFSPRPGVTITQEE